MVNRYHELPFDEMKEVDENKEMDENEEMGEMKRWRKIKRVKKKAKKMTWSLKTEEDQEDQALN